MDTESPYGFKNEERMDLCLGVNVILMPEIQGSTKRIPHEDKWFSGEIEVTTPTIAEAQQLLAKRIEAIQKQCEREGAKLIGMVPLEVLVDDTPQTRNFAIIIKE